jgi:AcrR family transcriptional regulator
MTTNRVAGAAKVSVGSLYHYFPTKEAIVAELARRLETRGLEMALERLMRGGVELPIPELVRTLVAILISPDIGLIAARRTLLKRVPPRWFAEASTAADREVRSWVAALVEQRRAELRDAPADIMAFVSFHAVEGVVEAAIEQRPELVDDPAFFEDLVRLLVDYVSSNAEGRPGKADASHDVGADPRRE